MTPPQPEPEQETPETDAAAFDIDCDDSSCGISNIYKSTGDCVPSELARRLERQRDEARAVADELMKWVHHVPWCDKEMNMHEPCTCGLSAALASYAALTK